MKRLRIIFLLLLLLLWAAAGRARAADVTEAQMEALETEKLEDAVPNSAADVMEGVSVLEALDVERVLDKLLETTKNAIAPIFKDALAGGAAILTISVLCAVIPAACGLDGKMRDFIRIAGVAATAAVAAGDVGTFAGLGNSVIQELNGFSKVLLPTLTSAAVASGAVTSAAAKYAATVLFMDVLVTLAEEVVMPLIYAYIAASIGAAALGGSGLSGAAGLIKWITTAAITLITLCFTAYLSITGVISGTTDAAAARLAKTVISTTLPVVGSILSDAASTVAGGASVLRNAVGVFGLLTVCAVCFIPFLKMGMHYLVYKAAGALSSSIAEGGASKLISAVGTAFGMMLGLTGSVALMIFISVISVLKVVTVT